MNTRKFKRKNFTFSRVELPVSFGVITRKERVNISVGGYRLYWRAVEKILRTINQKQKKRKQPITITTYSKSKYEIIWLFTKNKKKYDPPHTQKSKIWPALTKVKKIYDFISPITQWLHWFLSNKFKETINFVIFFI